MEKDDIKLCDTWIEESKSYEFYITKYINNAKYITKDCKTSCTHSQYIGQTTVAKGKRNKINEISVNYAFLSNEVQISEEYLMFAVNDLIGTIGGHSGLFIGFSFYGVISTIFGYFQRKM